MKTPYCVWAVVTAEIPFTHWWSQLCENMKWPRELILERWSGHEIHWSHVMDSVNTFSLFKTQKGLVILEADRAFKDQKNSPLPQNLFTRFQSGPHRIVFQSTQEPPKGLELPIWRSPDIEMKEEDGRIGFRWIDAVHSENLTLALTTLEAAFESGQHPLALLQLMTRHFRLGRLIQYAQQNRLREQEMTSTLRIQSFVIQKWNRKVPLSKARWASIFDRLLQADLELKSGADGIWVLRKLSFDLVRLHSPSEKRIKKTKKSLPPALQLWTASPSFA